MEALNTTLRLLAASQIILFLIQILFSNNYLRIRLVGTLMLLGCIGYLCLPLVDDHLLPMPYSVYVWLIPAIVPSMLLWFVWFIFEENCLIPAWIVIVTGTSILGSLWFAYHSIGLPYAPWWFQLFKLAIVGLALYVVGHGREQDLVELRFKFRYILIVALASLIFTAMVIDFITDFNPPKGLDSLTIAVTFVLSLMFNYFFLKLNPNTHLVREPKKLPIKDTSDDPLISELLERMRSERLYSDHDLRVAGLASLLNVPEYQLRSKINQQLGYRNFNQFVNRYRIEEAGIKLRDDERTPVLSIALDVGFRSISSFNTAFQQHFGVSPTKYRANALLKS